MTFGSTELLRGFDFLIAVIGLFGVGEILLTMEEGLAFKGRSAKINLRVVLHTWKELPKLWLTAIRGSIVGCWMGITPGGATPASFMSYGLAKRFSRNGSKFGKGELEGVLRRRRGPCGGYERAPAHADARHPGLTDRRRAPWRPADLGSAAGAASLRGAEGLRLGADRLDLRQ
jgi:hypothetical protein